MRCACRSRGCPARVRERFGEILRDDRAARVLHAARQVLPRPRAPARGRRQRGARRRAHAARPRRGPRRAGGLRGRRASPSCPSAAAPAWSAASSRCARASARSSRSTSGRSTRSSRWTSARSWPWWAAGCAPSSSRRALGERGFTLGHYPQSYEYVTIGGCAATRSAGQASTGYGRIDELVVGAAAGGAGRRPRPARRSRRAPRGPSCAGSSSARRACSARSRGWRCGCARRPSSRRYEGWMFASFGAGAEALRRLEQGGAAPDVARLSDEDETRLGLGHGRPARRARGRAAGLPARARRGAAARLAIVGWAGPGGAACASAARRPSRRCATRGGVALGQPAGRAWVRSRFHGPYLRDDLMDRGVMVETLETATTWAQLFTPATARWATSLRDARAARRLPRLAPLPDGRVAVLHLHGAGAPRRGARAVGARSRRRRARRSSRPAARSPITTRSGRDHAPYVEAEVGDTGVARAARAQGASSTRPGS